MKYDNLLIPPMHYEKVSDEAWEKAFGRVNKFFKTAKQLRECKPRTYEQIVAEKLNHDAKNKKKE